MCDNVVLWLFISIYINVLLYLLFLYELHFCDMVLNSFGGKSFLKRLSVAAKYELGGVVVEYTLELGNGFFE